jgi:DNA-binding FadR family transcriptional regulator
LQLDPVHRQRLYQEVAHRLEAMIRAGDLKEGSVLPSERELMETFRVGRPAVREALLSLQQKGLIAVTNGERARVTRPDAQRLIEALSGAASVLLATAEGVRSFQAARLLFEPAIARDAARRATLDDIARIGGALAANRSALRDPARFEQTDVAFHFEIVVTLGNDLITGLHRALSDWLAEQRRVALRARGAARRAFAFHERIFAAIEAHDPDAAERAMQAHLGEVGVDYWKKRDAA